MVNKKYLFFATAALTNLMASVDITIVATALPSLLRDLNTELVWAGWVLTGYMLMTAVAMPLAGKVSEIVGRKEMFIGCILLFTGSSLLAAISPNIYFLILFRLLQGLAGGAFSPLAMATVCDYFPRDRARMVGLFSSIMPIGGILGPTLAGLVIEHFSWRAIFLLNLPVGAVGALMSWAILERKPRRQGRPDIDLLGVLLLSGGILAAMYGMAQVGTEWSTGRWPVVVGPMVLAGLLLALFLRHEARTQHPVVELQLLKSKPFAATNLVNFLIGAGVFGAFSLVPLYASVVHGISALGSGVLLTPRSLGVITTSTLSSFLLHRTGYRNPIRAGFVVAGLATLLLGLVGPGVSIMGWAPGDFLVLACIIGVTGLGMGMAFPGANNAALELMPDRVAALSGLRSMFRILGGVFGASVLLLALSLFEDKALGLRQIFVALGLLLLAILPLVSMMPERTSLRRAPSTSATPLLSEAKIKSEERPKRVVERGGASRSV